MGFKESVAMAYLKGLRPFAGQMIYNQMAKKFNDDQKKSAQIAYDIFLAQNKNLPMKMILQNIEKLTSQGFDWISDPLFGALDFPGTDWLFFARKGGDCDKWASLHFDVLGSAHHPVAMWAVFNGSKIFGSAHIVTTAFNKENEKYVLCSNYDHIEANSEKEALEVLMKQELTTAGLYDKLWYVEWMRNSAIL